MNKINFSLIGCASYAVIGIVIVIALFFRYRSNRLRQVVKPVRHYHCLSGKLFFQGLNETTDTTPDSITTPSELK